MLIPHVFAKHDIAPRGVLHIGAHDCEEAPVYSAAGVCPETCVVWVEGHPVFAAEAKARHPRFTIIEACVSDAEEVADFIETNNRESSSLLELHEHKAEHPHVVETRRLKVQTKTMRTVAREHALDMARFDFLVLDVQGAELRVLRGMAELLCHFEHVYTEVNTRELYKGCALLDEVQAFLGEHGFERKDMRLTTHGWGDALFSRSRASSTLQSRGRPRSLPDLPAYYINLEHRTDRNLLITRQLDEYGVLQRRRVPGTRAAVGPVGCSMSHIRTLELFLESGHPACLVFEDDFEFVLPKDTVHDMFARFFADHGDEWDVVMLSSNTLVSVPAGPYLDKALDVQTASGYMVNRRVAPTLLANFREGLRLFERSLAGCHAVDMHWKSLQPRLSWFIFNPKMGRQRAGYSDNERREVDYGC